MLKLKACPRCRGDLLVSSYWDDRTADCLQCGYTSSLPASEALSPTPKLRGVLPAGGVTVAKRAHPPRAA